MNSRALTLAVRLLTTACAGAALGTLTGCPFLFDFECPEPWGEVESVALLTEADILALAQVNDFGEFVGVGVGGVVVHHGRDGAQLSNPTNATLRDVVASGPTIVVGDGGTILSSSDRGASWTARDSGVTDDLVAITDAPFTGAPHYVAVAAERVLYSSDSGQTWAIVNPPAEGWGGLRAAFFDGERVWVVGAGGNAWSSNDPAGAWLREQVGVSEALIGGGRVAGDLYSNYASGLAVATSTRVLFRAAGETAWTEINGDFDGAIAAYGGGYVVTVNGTVHNINESGVAERIADVGLVPLAITGAWDGFIAAGEGGNAARASYALCVGGRPWTIDGELAPAKLVRGDRWSGAPERGGVEQLGPDLRERLAAAWARDGQYEHASIASFARVVVELLALGAPPELILASRRAIVDELDHARRCFAQASRYAEACVGPGPLPIAGELARRSPEQIAVAMFEEGCVNESVAAAEAALAASESRDPRVRATLERIAADEREHAALAWKTLRWLLDAFPYEVAPALRRSLARLGAPPVPAPEPEPDRALREHGRLPASERAVIQRKVLAELVVPLARELLGNALRARA